MDPDQMEEEMLGSDDASQEDFDFDVNSKKGAVVDLSKDGGVMKTILEEGEGYKKPESGDSVAVHYVGTLEDGTKFDSSRDRGEPFNFTLGKGQVIKGWDIGVASMKKGEKANLKCRSEYAYGAAGSPPTIPENATLNFEVELLYWRSVSDMTGDGGVIKKILKEGSGYETPGDKDEVLVKYTAKVGGTATVFAASPEEGVEFALSDGHLCIGLARAVKEMKEGEEAVLTLSPKYSVPPGSEEETPDTQSSLEIELTLVSWKKVEHISDDGLVVKKTFRKGEGYERPKEGATVTIRYTGRLKDGTVFEERQEGNEFEFTIDEEQVVDGLDKAIMKMKKGEVAEISIASKYAFAEETKRDLATVPAGADVVYIVELVELVNPRGDHDLSVQEKLDKAKQKKEQGNKAYKEGKFIRAVSKYEQALKPIEFDSNFDQDLKIQSKEMKKTIWLNIAAVALKLNEYTKAVANCSKVLDIEPNNVKALFRRSQGYMYRSDFIEAESDIKKAHDLEPANRDVIAQYKKLKQVMKQWDKKDAELYSNIFKKMAGKS